MGRLANSYAGKVAARRAVEAARACELEIGELVFLPDGEIRVVAVRAVAADRGDEFAQWESRL